jgi:carbon-monoxide dehydrogenase large subunit
MTTHIGRALPRLEDEKFITGEGRYTDDIDRDGQAYAVMVRSPHAHAEIISCDSEAAVQSAGVLGVYTSADLEAAGICAVTSFTRTPPYQMFNADGSEMPEASQYPLATDRVRYVGEPVAMVVAATMVAARDAAELVNVTYRELPAVASIEAARDSASPLIWPELADNRSCFWEAGDAQATDALFREAAHVVETTVAYPRRIIAFMEPRSAVAHFDETGGRYVIEAGCQGAHSMRDELARALDVETACVRVIVPDTGGGFGVRGMVYPEFVCALFAARALGQPVKWTASRSESFVSDAQARSQRTTAELALDAKGVFLAVRYRVTWCHGGYLAPHSVFIVLGAMPTMICGPYRIKAQHFALEGMFTTTTPVASYRGVGRSEAGYVLERLIDTAARQTGFDAIELRRRNLIAPGDMPYTSVAGLTYEPALFEHNFDVALDAVDAAGFEQRRKDAAQNRQWRGLAASPFIITAGGESEEFATVQIEPDGTVVVHAGTQDFGMGHKTAFAQIAADHLGVEPDKVRVMFGDTDGIGCGGGGHSSRCMQMGGGAVVKACDAALTQAGDIAAEELEVAREELIFDAGMFIIQGTDRAIGLADIARMAADSGRELKSNETFTTDSTSFPNGAHAVEVEVDPDTGTVALVKVASVIDPGRVINPMLVEGQMHGGVVQGIGEAMLEHVVFEDDTAQLLSGSFLDFALPRADDVPGLTTCLEPQASLSNPLGVKGVGEMGNMVIQAVVVNAVLDAMAHSGVGELDMPITPLRVWQAIRQAGTTELSSLPS